MQLLRFFVALFILLAVSSPWPNSTHAQSAPTSIYEFINLTGSPLDFYRDGGAVFFNNAGVSRSAERVINDPQTTLFSVYAANSDPTQAEPVADLSLELIGGETLALIAVTDAQGAIQLVRHQYDLNALGPNRARLEVLHLSPALPALNAIGQNGDPLLTDITPGAASFADVPAGTYQMGFKPAQTPTGDDAYTTTLNLAVGQVHSLIFYGGEQAAAFEVIHAVEQLAALRVVHAGRVLPAVDIYLGQTALFLELAYLDASDYITLPSGEYQVKVVAGGASVNGAAIWEGPLTLASNAPLTAVLFGENQARLSVYQDDHLQMPPNQARVRFINAAFNLPLLTVSGQSEPLADGLEYALGSRNLAVEAGQYSYGFAETQGDLYATLADITIQANHHYTYVVAGNPIINNTVEVIALEWYWNTPEAE
jgi:hypothetical protein